MEMGGTPQSDEKKMTNCNLCGSETSISEFRTMILWGEDFVICRTCYKLLNIGVVTCVPSLTPELLVFIRSRLAMLSKWEGRNAYQRVYLIQEEMPYSDETVTHEIISAVRTRAPRIYSIIREFNISSFDYALTHSAGEHGSDTPLTKYKENNASLVEWSAGPRSRARWLTNVTGDIPLHQVEEFKSMLNSNSPVKSVIAPEHRVTDAPPAKRLRTEAPIFMNSPLSMMTIGFPDAIQSLITPPHARLGKETYERTLKWSEKHVKPLIEAFKALIKIVGPFISVNSGDIQRLYSSIPRHIASLAFDAKFYATFSDSSNSGNADAKSYALFEEYLSLLHNIVRGSASVQRSKLASMRRTLFGDFGIFSEEYSRKILARSKECLSALEAFRETVWKYINEASEMQESLAQVNENATEYLFVSEFIRFLEALHAFINDNINSVRSSVLEAGKSLKNGGEMLADAATSAMLSKMAYRFTKLEDYIQAADMYAKIITEKTTEEERRAFLPMAWAAPSLTREEVETILESGLFSLAPSCLRRAKTAASKQTRGRYLNGDVPYICVMEVSTRKAANKSPELLADESNDLPMLLKYAKTDLENDKSKTTSIRIGKYQGTYFAIEMDVAK